MRFYACCIDVKRVPMAFIDEVPKFSFDIFLKYNPTINEPLIRNNLKIFVGKNMTNPSNQPKSQMFEFKTQDHTRIYVLHASMVSNWVDARMRARNRPTHIKCLGCHLGRCLECTFAISSGDNFRRV